MDMRMMEEKLQELKQRKALLNDENNLPMIIEQIRIQNEQPYELPADINANRGFEKETIYDIDTYILKGEGYPSGKHIFYLHGGAYVSQPLDEHWLFLQHVAKQTGATITVPIYPKAPNYQYQESFDKVTAIFTQLLGKINPDQIVLMGDSAGAGFALALAQLFKEKGIPQPGNIILMSPWLDVSMSNPDISALESVDPMLGTPFLVAAAKAYAGGTDLTDPLLSPIYGSIEGLGKITLFVGTHELFLADCRKFKDMAEQQGIDINYYEYPNMIHVFPVIPAPLPEVEQAKKEIVDIINSI
ncbi:alpha/beta hydrolase [Paenibacillus wenxiniae]|uniref:Alpha/beta hydrolase fold domain-containing protein n=1 Tax=Paenibacillus wenxiniae TaxID=1636843 RepID=A0ABW4RNE8_9BACL